MIGVLFGNAPGSGNGIGNGRKRHQSALHGGGVFLRLPVAELLVV